MKIEEQDLPPFSPQVSMAPPPHKNYSSGILLGFQEMFQQSIHDELVVAKRKADDYSGQESDPFTTNKRTRVELLQLEEPNVNGPDNDQHNWHNDFDSTIASLNAKHGAIDKDCNLSSKWMIKLNLFGIWGLLKQLEKKRLGELDLSSLSPYYKIVRDAEKLNFNVKWLHERLDDIRVAVVARHEAKRLEATKNDHVKERKQKEAKLSWLQYQVKELENQVAGKDLEIEVLSEEINNETSKFQHFESAPLLDGLI